MDFQITTKSEAETIVLGSHLAQLLSSGDVVALFGDLGSGKTCFIRGICQGLKIKDDVSSPTFTIINEYTNNLPVYHFDFYRITNADEIYGLGYEEYFYNSGICLIEWADRVQNFLPFNRIEIHLTSFFESGKENIRDIKIKILGEDTKQRNWESIMAGLIEIEIDPPNDSYPYE